MQRFVLSSMRRILAALVILGTAVMFGQSARSADDPGTEALRKAVTLYSSFDENQNADFAGGGKELNTRFSDEKDKTKHFYENGIDSKIYAVEKGKGVHGGCLNVTKVHPKSRGRVYYPAKGNLAYKKGGWAGALSVWINIDPNTALKTQFCDPVQISQKSSDNGGIWVDFNDAKPQRDLRLGVFTALKEGEKAIPEEDPNAPLVWYRKAPFKVGDWHHVAISWKNYDTGKKDSVSTLYIDGKLIGDIKDREITMDWDLDKTGIYFAINYIGMMDELAVFDRALTDAEVGLLHKNPGILAALKHPPAKKP